MFLYTALMEQNHIRRYVSSSSPGGGTGGEVWCLRSSCCDSYRWWCWLWHLPRVQLAWYPSQTLSTQRTLHLTSALTQPIVADRPSALRSNHVCSGTTSGSAQPTTAINIRNHARFALNNSLWRRSVQSRPMHGPKFFGPARPCPQFNYQLGAYAICIC